MVLTTISVLFLQFKNAPALDAQSATDAPYIYVSVGPLVVVLVEKCGGIVVVDKDKFNAFQTKVNSSMTDLQIKQNNQIFETMRIGMAKQIEAANGFSHKTKCIVMAMQVNSYLGKDTPIKQIVK